MAVSTAGSTEWRTRHNLLRFFIGCSVGSLHKNTNNCKFYNYWRWERTTWLCGMNKSLMDTLTKLPWTATTCRNLKIDHYYPGSSGRMLFPIPDRPLATPAQEHQDRPTWSISGRKAKFNVAAEVRREITAQRRELHCYWLGGCGAACQPVDWPSGGYFKL